MKGKSTFNIRDSFEVTKKKPEMGIDYEENADTFVIYNVPILAEMVQTYEDGYAYKKADEILKVNVDQIPLTLVEDEPTHPEAIVNSNTYGKRNVIVGYMSEPVRAKDKKSLTKRYADFVLYNTPKIQALKDEYIAGNYVDTSVGFEFNKDVTPGEFLDQKYDYIQRDIKLDHNAILIDIYGNKGIGRMPSPIGGIGADSITCDQKIKGVIDKIKSQLKTDNPDLVNNDIISLIDSDLWDLAWLENPLTSPNDNQRQLIELSDDLIKSNKDVNDNNVYSVISNNLWRMRTKDSVSSDNIKSVKDAITRFEKVTLNSDTKKQFQDHLFNHLDKYNKGENNMANDELQKKYDALVIDNDALKKKVADSKDAGIQSKLDSAVSDSAKIKVDLKDTQDKLKVSEDALKVFTDKEDEAFSKVKEAVDEKYKDVLDGAEMQKDWYQKKFDEMNKAKGNKENSRDIGSDMLRGVESAKNEAGRINTYLGKDKTKDKKN